MALAVIGGGTVPTIGDISPTSRRPNARQVGILVGILSDRLVGILSAGQHMVRAGSQPAEDGASVNLLL